MVAVPDMITPARSMRWGALKARYRSGTGPSDRLHALQNPTRSCPYTPRVAAGMKCGTSAPTTS